MGLPQIATETEERCCLYFDLKLSKCDAPSKTEISHCGETTVHHRAQCGARSTNVLGRIKKCLKLYF